MAEISKWFAKNGRRVVLTLPTKPGKAFTLLTTIQSLAMLLTYVFLHYT
jgi:hypothetical protein